MSADSFLRVETIMIICLGLAAFIFSTAGGVIFGQIMKVMTKKKVNPIIGAAGVSAVPMAARVCQKVVQKEFPGSYILMHAMGPNVAGVIGTRRSRGHADAPLEIERYIFMKILEIMLCSAATMTAFFM